MKNFQSRIMHLHCMLVAVCLLDKLVYVQNTRWPMSIWLILLFLDMVGMALIHTQPLIRLHGGAKGNVIPNEVKLELTLRSYKDEVRTAILEKIKRTCRGVGLSAGLHEDELPIVTVRRRFWTIWSYGR